jgi:hypothetical protein
MVVVTTVVEVPDPRV